MPRVSAPSVVMALLLASGCVGDGVDPGGEAATIAAGARRAVGWIEEPGRAPEAVRFHASVEWEGPPYEVTVVSSSDGRVRLGFVDGAAFGVSSRSRWSIESPGVVAPLSGELETFARGHDFFSNLVHPETRLRSLRFTGVTEFGNRPALLVTGADAVGGVVHLYYAEADTLPLGYEVDDHVRGGGTVTTTLTAWAEQGELRLPTAVRVAQGAEVFRYSIEEAVVLRVAPDSLFEAPGH